MIREEEKVEEKNQEALRIDQNYIKKTRLPFHLLLCKKTATRKELKKEKRYSPPLFYQHQYTHTYTHTNIRNESSYVAIPLHPQIHKFRMQK
jgi:hypothetical protein